MMVFLYAGARAQAQEQLALIKEMMEIVSPAERESLIIPKTGAHLPKRNCMRECVVVAKSLLRPRIMFLAKQTRIKEEQRQCLNLRVQLTSLLRFLRGKRDGAL
jgi:hypothetical protein